MEQKDERQEVDKQTPTGAPARCATPAAHFDFRNLMAPDLAAPSKTMVVKAGFDFLLGHHFFEILELSGANQHARLAGREVRIGRRITVLEIEQLRRCGWAIEELW